VLEEEERDHGRDDHEMNDDDDGLHRATILGIVPWRRAPAGGSASYMVDRGRLYTFQGHISMVCSMSVPRGRMEKPVGTCLFRRPRVHSTISSTRERSPRRRSRRSAFAVVRLRTSSKLLAEDAGRSAGLWAFRMGPAEMPSWGCTAAGLRPKLMGPPPPPT